MAKDQRPIVVWLRNDLRIADNPALREAVDAGAPVVPVYVHDTKTPGAWAPGAASRWWLHHSLRALSDEMGKRGNALVLSSGSCARVVPRLAEEVNARAVYWNRAYEPYWRGAEDTIIHTLERLGVETRACAGNMLFQPGAIRTANGDAYRVFTPFWKACLAAPEPSQPLAAPRAFPALRRAPQSERLDDWALPKEARRLDDTLGDLWEPGEAGAKRRLDEFLRTALDRYSHDRDRPDLPGTSRLSPHLHFGEISARQVWHTVGAFTGKRHSPNLERQALAFLRELAWREFSIHLLEAAPDLPDAPLRPEFAAFPWASDAKALKAWREGRTGYAIVDAGMRELWRTGYMHNRVRMVVASFLIKDLRIPWREGEAWFWETLVDADLANNAASWQWVAGCGADAAPFFRIFNPVRQGEKFDPDGAYTRRWVPEIAALPTAYLQNPWEAPEEALEEADVELGKTYPQPIVDHALARQEALAAYEDVRLARS